MLKIRLLFLGVFAGPFQSEELDIAESVKLLAATMRYFKCSFVEAMTKQKMLCKTFPRDPAVQSFSAHVTLILYLYRMYMALFKIWRLLPYTS